MEAALEIGLQRHFDAARLNEIANHPDVRPTCGGDGKSEIDLRPFLADRNNHALLWEHGYFLFFWSAPHTYEVHMAVLPEGRGREAYRLWDDARDYIVQAGAERLWARIAHNFNSLHHYTAQAGFERCGTWGSYDLYQWVQRCLQR